MDCNWLEVISSYFCNKGFSFGFVLLELVITEVTRPSPATRPKLDGSPRVNFRASGDCSDCSVVDRDRGPSTPGPPPHHYAAGAPPMSRVVPCNDLGVPMLSECPVSSVSVYSEPESPVPFPVLSGTTSGSSSSSSSSSVPSFGGEARYPERIREPSSKCKDNVSHSALAAYTSNDIDVEDPISLTEALSSPQAQAWRSAMQEEYNALIRNNTWDLVLRSRVKARGYTVIGGKWVF